MAGLGIGAMFPLTSALHVKASAFSADVAVGQVLTMAAPGQLAGPLVAGAIAQAAGLRAGLLILPVLTLVAAAALHRHSLSERSRRARRARRQAASAGSGLRDPHASP